MTEKTEKATRKKVQDARSRGEVARSQDLVKLLALGAAFETAIFLHARGMDHLSAIFLVPLDQMGNPFSTAVNNVVSFTFLAGGMLSVSLALLVVIVKVGGYWVQQGINIAPKALKPDWNRVNPVTQLKNLFTVQKLYELFTSLLKAFLIGLIFTMVIQASLGTLLLLGTQTLSGGMENVVSVLALAVRSSLAALLALTLVDIWAQRMLYQRKLLMSQHEVKQERKNTDGNPEIRQRRRSLAQEWLMSDDGPSLDQADVVVVNPTHVAVALIYRPETVPLPRVLAKAADDDALRLIQEAHQRGIPVIRYLWLARTLHGEAREHQTIPRTTLEAVAAIYRVLRQWPPEQPPEEDGSYWFDPENPLKPASSHSPEEQA